jgi:hypothetical protein
MKTLSPLKKVLLFALVSVSVIFSLFLCYFIAEKYFFDKVFYLKSVRFGYYKDGVNNLSWQYGKRAEDLRSLHDFINKYPQDDSQLKPAIINKDFYTIVIVGDSYVWGQGITNDQRFAAILEKKLNKIRPTKIYSLAEDGANIFDNYIKYKIALKMYDHVDMVMFGMVYNDLFIEDYYQKFYSLLPSSINECQGEQILDPAKNGTLISGDEYWQKAYHSFDKETKNFCMFQELVKVLPKEKAVYLNFDDFRLGKEMTDRYANPLRESGLTVLSFEDFYKKHYSKYPLTLKDGSDFFAVSKIDGHPSALANQMYSEALFEEITSKPTYQFK